MLSNYERIKYILLGARSISSFVSDYYLNNIDALYKEMV